MDDATAKTLRTTVETAFFVYAKEHGYYPNDNPKPDDERTLAEDMFVDFFDDFIDSVEKEFRAE